MDIKGFKINFLGDSITEGSGVSNPANNRFDNRLAAMCGITAKNYGIGGSRLAHQMQPSENPRYDLCFCGRAYNMDKTADMIIVYGGVNDFIHGDAPFGQPGDTTPATYCGAVYFLMNYLRTVYGNKPILFLTPARCFLRHEVSDLVPSTHAKKTTPGKPLLAYVEAIQEAAKQFGIHVVDLYHGLGVDPHKPEDFAAYTTDGLHLNDAGHGLLAEKVKAFIEAL